MNMGCYSLYPLKYSLLLYVPVEKATSNPNQNKKVFGDILMTFLSQSNICEYCLGTLNNQKEGVLAEIHIGT